MKFTILILAIGGIGFAACGESKKEDPAKETTLASPREEPKEAPKTVPAGDGEVFISITGLH